MNPLPPLHREVLVESGQERAFEVFTAQIGDWWPLGSHSLHGEGGSVAFEDGEIVERSAGGEVSVWGRITRREPPDALASTDQSVASGLFTVQVRPWQVMLQA